LHGSLTGGQRNELFHGVVAGCGGRRHGHSRLVVAMTEPKTFAERLDAAENGESFGAVISDMLAALADAKDHINNAVSALQDLEVDVEDADQ
jgi:hypothetical protein